jgi:2-polyprenyl-6-methoxyphenol hydroxylase-like FAD-dependent oxidoreductase
MAAELARRGISCRIIDRLAQPLPYCRAIGVSPRTLEIWDDMGVAGPMMDAGLWLRGTRSHINGSPGQDSFYNLFDLPYGHLGIPQPETERILNEHLSSFGISVERPVAIKALEQNGERVQVELSHNEDRIEIAEFRYVIGCDGARSSVRQLLEIPFDGDHFPFGFMLGDVVLDYDLPRGMMLRSIKPIENAPPDFFVAIPLPERNRYRVSALAPSDPQGELTWDRSLNKEVVTPTIEELQAVADRLLPGKKPMSDLRWSSFFRIGMRLARSYREGRCFLAGDAAHIHPPTGGQGMNTGIQDAYNLAWKLSLVLKGTATEDLLDSYEQERRPVGAEVIARTLSQSQQFGRKESSEEERLADTQILVNYRGSRLSVDEIEGPLPQIMAGDRAPDCSGLLRDDVRHPFRLFDILRGSEYVLVVYAGSDTEGRLVDEISKELERLDEFKCRLIVIYSPEADTSEMVGHVPLKDSRGEFAAVYSPDANTAYLIRPDGYIGYHARPLSVDGLLRYVQKSASA